MVMGESPAGRAYAMAGRGLLGAQVWGADARLGDLELRLGLGGAPLRTQRCRIMPSSPTTQTLFGTLPDTSRILKLVPLGEEDHVWPSK